MKILQLAHALRSRLFGHKQAHTTLKPHTHIAVINRALQQRERVFFLLAFAFFLVASFAYFSIHKLKTVEASWFNHSWLYRKTVAITNGGSAQTDYQVAITLDTASLITAGKMQNNCADIRIITTNGKQLPIWIETGANGCNSATTAIWTKLSTISTSGATVYVYYGNTSAPDIQNGDKVFIFFDDFSGSSIDSTKWSQGTIAATSGTNFSQSSGTLAGGNTNRYIRSVDTYSGDYVAETRMYTATLAANGFSTIGFFASSANSFGILDHSNSSYYRNDAGWTGFAYNGTSQWNRDKVKVVGTAANYWRTGETSGSLTGSTTNSGLSSEYVYLGARYDASATNQNYVATWDWILVRKAVTTEPVVGSPATEEQSEGPIAYWKFDEGHGLSANNSTSTTGINGTLTGTSLPIWQTTDACISGTCLKFDGNVSSVQISSTNIDYTAPFSLSMWFYGNDFTNPDAPELFNQQLSGGWIDVRVGYANELEFQVKTATGTMEINSPNNYISTNKWYHFVVVYDPSTSSKMYIDGVQMSNTSATNVGTLTKSGNTRIGVGFNGWEWNGKIDEVKMYPYARTAVQVKSDYAAGIAGTSSVLGLSAGLGSSKDTNTALSNGLIAYWKMDETGANTCTGGINDSCDSSGNAINGAWLGNATTTSGKFGNGVSFDNVGDVVSLGSPTALNFGNNGSFTFAGWIKPTTLADYDAFISKNTIPRTSPYSYMTVFMANGRLMAYNSSTWISLCPAGSVVTGSWQHVVFNYNGTIMTGYINGESCGSVAFTYPDNAAYEVSIGSWYAPNTAYDFNGVMDDVRIYNRTLSPKEVRDLYSWAPGPYAYYSFDEGTGSSINDKSGNDYTGSWNGTGTHWTQGKYGKAAHFDGSSDYVSFSSLPKPSNLPITIEFWTKPNTSTPVGIFDSAPGSGYVFRNYSTGKVEWWSGSPQITLGLSAGIWTHLSFVYDYTGGNQTITWYKNSVKQTTGSTAGAGTWAWTTFRLGNINSGSAGWYAGDLDEFKIYNYARTPGQIVQDMNAGHPLGGSPIASQLAYYKFDEGTGTAANNSGNGGSTLNGVLRNSPTFTTSGKFSKGMQLDGLNDYVEVPHTASITYTGGDLTVSTWVNLDSTDDGGVIISKPWNGSGQYNYRINSTGGANPSLSFILVGASTYTLNFNQTISANQWHYLSASVDSSGNVKLYIDGKLSNSATHTITSWTPGAGDGNIPLAIGTLYPYGQGWAGVTGQAIKGTIDEVKIYTAALSQSEILVDMNRGASMVLGTTSTDASGNTSNAADREYCVPGDTTSCSAPVAEWKFDEGTGGSVNDTSGNGNTGMWNGSGTHWTQGKIGKAGKFLRANVNYVNMGINNIPFGSSARTFQAWINPINSGGVIVGTNAVSGQKYYIEIGNVSGTWYLFTDGVNSANNITLTGSEIPTLGQWNHIAFSLDGSNGWTYYLNGKYIKSGTFSVSINTNTPTSTYVGNRSDVGGYSFDGSIDQVRIYNYARTPAQISWDYNRGTPVGHWKLDECQGITANDTSGNGNVGTITIGGTGTQISAGTCTTASTAWGNGVNGTYNSSLNFDGTDDYVTIPGSSILTLGNDMTLSSWIKTSFSSGERPILSNRSGGGGALYFGILNSKGFLYYSGASPASITTNKVITNSAWHLVTFVRSGNTSTYYVDGNYDNSITQTGYVPHADAIRIAHDVANVTEYFPGQIDDVRIYTPLTLVCNPKGCQNSLEGVIPEQFHVRVVYNYALTATQVKSVYNQGSAIRFGPQTGAP